ncbi:hypothetical protein Lal_00026199 [Lupinus albus]|nr:hypothetical protein Lal_00026199 [Lupinus albus]
MEIPRGQKFIQTKRGSTGKSFRSNPFLGSKKDKGYVSDLARHPAARDETDGLRTEGALISWIPLIFLSQSWGFCGI